LKLSEQCIEQLLKEYKLPDQDVINIVCKGKIHYLNQKWNCTLLTKEVLQRTGIRDIINNNLHLERIVHEYNLAYYGNKSVLHYTADRKPWNYLNIENGDKWWYYCRHTIHYEDLLQYSLNNLKEIGQKILPLPYLKKISFLGIPLIRIKKDCSRTRFYFLGLRWLKITQKGNRKYFYFFRLKFMKQQIS